MSTFNPSVTTTVNPAPTPRWSHLKQVFGQLKKQIAEWHCRTLSRHELMTLDDRELWDIGLTRLDAEHESGKPFWVPMVSNGLIPPHVSLHLTRMPLDAR